MRGALSSVDARQVAIRRWPPFAAAAVVFDPRARPRRPVPRREWNFHVAPRPPTPAKTWIIDHRSTNWVFSSIPQPITDLLVALVRWTQDVPTSSVGPASSSPRPSSVPGRESRQALRQRRVAPPPSGSSACGSSRPRPCRLMIVAVAICCLRSACRSASWPAAIRRSTAPPRLPRRRADDAAPICHLLFTVLLIRHRWRPPAVIATVIFALAPASSASRRTASAPGVGRAHRGRRRRTAPPSRQVLSKVQWLVARPAILLGVNQVIMMAFGVVVIASARRLAWARPVRCSTPREGQRRAGPDAGSAIVLVAVILDRIPTGPALRRGRAYARQSRSGRGATCPSASASSRWPSCSARLHARRALPSGWTYSLSGSASNSLVDWLQANVRNGACWSSAAPRRSATSSSPRAIGSRCAR